MKLGFPSKKVLLTGINGFTGVHLKCALEDAGYQVFGLTHSRSAKTNQFTADLSDKRSLLEVIKSVSPDYVIHLAAISFVAHGDSNDFYRVNVLGTENLLQALVQSNVNLKKVIVSSSANVYGNLGGVISENACPQPVNHYACSKLSMERIVRNYFDALPIIITRPFNYTGIGQANHFLVPKIVSHFKDAKSIIELGNIDVYRDFSAVTFVADSYLKMLESNYKSEIFNICSGKSISLQEIIGHLESLSGHKIDVKVNQNFVRKNEVTSITGDNEKLLQAFPELKVIDIKNILEKMLEE
ncbi:MAG TPA: hypothetical protein DCZ37_06970 [Alteromonas macleodii]|nr:hypothetical protein [Alteromonas macleodii]|tara:strand:+ start:1649 stop:2545 length:897 start_codon:yes stop_codon:yes gene_type:complete